MRSNGKENVETLSQTLNTYFEEKYLNHRIDMALGRNETRKIAHIESHDVKLICAMRARNWNRSYYPFIRCYCQRGCSLKPFHQCDAMADDEHMIHYKNVLD